MCELLSTREGLGDDQSKKLTPAGDAASQGIIATPQRKIVLLGLDSPHSSGHWDETPEDLALTSHRLASVLEKLTLQNHFLSLELQQASQAFPLCHRLLAVARRFQELCLPSPLSEPTATESSSEYECRRHDALVELLADSALSYGLSLISQLKPLIQDSSSTSSSKVRLLSRVKVQRDLMVSIAQFGDFAQLSLRILNPTATPERDPLALADTSVASENNSKIFGMFVRCLVTLASLSSQETLFSILAQVTGVKAGGTGTQVDLLLSLLRALSRSSNCVSVVSLSDINRYRKASQLIVEWIQSR
jgi:hypothetical protein